MSFCKRVIKDSLDLIYFHAYGKCGNMIRMP